MAVWFQRSKVLGGTSHQESKKEAWDGLATDQLRPVGSILATQGEILEMVAQGDPLEEVLKRLCLLIEQDVQQCLCSIMLVEKGKLVLGAGPSLPETYACGMDGMEIAEGIGPCGSAAHRKEMAIYGDIESSDLLAETRQFILDHDVRACWSIPLFSSKKEVIGTFAISLTDAKEPSEYQFELLRTAGHLAGIAIGRQHADRERRRLEKELMHRQKLESLGLMAGGIAHDFNNLLTAIVGSLSLLERELDLSTGGQRRLQLAQKAADAATDLTTEMLTYAGLASVQLGEVDLAQEVRDVVEVVRVSRERPVAFETQLEEAARYLHGDASQVRQLVHNLVQNGVDALPSEGGRINVWLRLEEITATAALVDHSGAPIPPGRYAVLGVEDTGTGIEAARLSQVFDPFFSSKKSGRGLGLAMVLGGARAHDGHIHITSHLGRGTAIQVFFPSSRLLRHDAADAPSASQAMAPTTTAARPLSFLLVEDEWSIRELVSDILSEEGWTVHTANDGLEGWAKWQELHNDNAQGIDAVFLDRCMPGLSGDELMRRIRGESPGIPIIITSGYGATSLAALLDEGVDAVLPKPFTSENLLTIVRNLTSPS